MKKTIQIIVNCLITIIIFIVVLSSLCRLVERKDSDIKYKDFFSQKEDFDILFLGSSHTIYGIYPMELWDDYGLISYNMGGHGNRIPTDYIVLKEALKYTTPELVVIDCFNITSNRMYSDSIEQVHLSLDAFPLSFQKAQGIHELINDSSLESEFLWDFVTYHNRWDSLTQNDFKPELSVTKGAEMGVYVAVPNKITLISPSQKMEQDTNGIIYLEKIITLCQENDIDVLLTYLPFPSTEEDQKEANRVSDIASKYHIPYINFLQIDGIVNYNTDCLDEGSHLNPSGGKKVTDYIGNYIMKNYTINNHTSDSEYSYWNDDEQDYIKYKISLLENTKSLTSYLMLLYDNDFTYRIEINPSSDILQDPQIQELLHNLNDNYILTEMDSDINISITVLWNNQTATSFTA